jgi:hypothetical protein
MITSYVFNRTSCMIKSYVFKQDTLCDKVLRLQTGPPV